jgi:hypothetical protein
MPSIKRLQKPKVIASNHRPLAISNRIRIIVSYPTIIPAVNFEVIQALNCKRAFFCFRETSGKNTLKKKRGYAFA